MDLKYTNSVYSKIYRNWDFWFENQPSGTLGQKHGCQIFLKLINQITTKIPKGFKTYQLAQRSRNIPKHSILRSSKTFRNWDLGHTYKCTIWQPWSECDSFLRASGVTFVCRFPHCRPSKCRHNHSK
jgi:hypothetical protein